MTDYVGPMKIQDCLDRIEVRLGRQFIKSQYTRLEDALSPSDPDMKIILKLREKTREDGSSGQRRHRQTHTLDRLVAQRNVIKEQLKAGWTRNKIAEYAGVSAGTMSGFLHSDAELEKLMRKRGNQCIPNWKVKQIKAMHDAGKTDYQIAKKLKINKKTVARYLVNLKLGVLDENSL